MCHAILWVATDSLTLLLPAISGCLLPLQAKVMSGLHTKLKALEQELEAEETQQKAIVEKKNDALAKLEAAKEEREAGQADYR